VSADPGPGVSPRIAALRTELFTAVAASGERTLHSRDEWKDVERLRIAAYRAHADSPAVVKRARAFAAIVRGRRVSVGPGDILAGSQKNFVLSSRPPDPETAALERERSTLGIASSDGHIVPGFAAAVGKGFLALGREAGESAARFPAGDLRRTTLQAMRDAALAAAAVG